uniref:(northern house mosquito) hypothetical protein n=1 Tax=Culex pipiens TaxID=7175 RepID=A0A8D8D267_CULPI
MKFRLMAKERADFSSILSGSVALDPRRNLLFRCCRALDDTTAATFCRTGSSSASFQLGTLDHYFRAVGSPALFCSGSCSRVAALLALFAAFAAGHFLFEFSAPRAHCFLCGVANETTSTIFQHAAPLAHHTDAGLRGQWDHSSFLSRRGYRIHPLKLPARRGQWDRPSGLLRTSPCSQSNARHFTVWPMGPLFQLLFTAWTSGSPVGTSA